MVVFHLEYLGSGIFGVAVKQGPSTEQAKDVTLTAGKIGAKSASSAAFVLGRINGCCDHANLFEGIDY